MDVGNLYWLVFSDGHHYDLSPYWGQSKQEALRHGLENVLDRTLVAVIADDLGMTVRQMINLAKVLPAPGSRLWRRGF